MSENLASILTKSAEQHGDRIAREARRRGAELHGGQRGRQARGGPAEGARASSPGDRVGVMLPNVPYFPSVYYGVLRARLHRRADERAAQGARGPVLPRGLRARSSCSPGTTSPRPPSRAPKEAGAECVLVDPADFDQIVFEQRAGRGDGRRRRRRHRGDPLHLAAPPASPRAPS